MDIQNRRDLQLPPLWVGVRNRTSALILSGIVRATASPHLVGCELVKIS